MFTNNSQHLTKRLLAYTMTNGLGDYLVMGDLIRKAEACLPDTRCIIIHRGNPYVDLWPEETIGKRFFDVYSLHQLSALANLLRRVRLNGTRVFALQMAPGSMQGFLFYVLLKWLKLIDYIVDFNLINADIITPPPAGAYILHLHLDQLRQLFKCRFPDNLPRLELPLRFSCEEKNGHDLLLVGIHPWTRRSSQYLMWQDDKWLDVAEHLIACGATPVLFGKDKRFNEFGRKLIDKFGREKVLLKPSSTVNELVQTINSFSLLVSLNSSVIHIAYARNIPAVVLSGPHLAIWTPKDSGIVEIRDQHALYPPSDERKADDVIPKVSEIPVDEVTSAIDSLLSTL